MSPCFAAHLVFRVATFSHNECDVCLVTQSCPTLCDSTDYCLPGSSVHGDSPGKNTGLGCHPLLQGIFPIQASNPGLPHCRWILYCLSHQGSPRILQWELIYVVPSQGHNDHLLLTSLALSIEHLMMNSYRD